MSRPFRAAFRLQEGGLVLVILVLGALLTGFGGSVRLPRFDTLPGGSRQRVFTTDTDGNKTPVFDNKNKFLNSQNLAQLAKDTSFTAIMAVGMTFVIIAGQIDLSVGATYALASVLGALVLQQFGPDGKHAASPLFGAGLGAFTCVGVGALCGLANGGMIVGLRVHPFIITLGTMAVFRGIAFVVTRGQSIGGFPAAFRAMITSPTLLGTGGCVPLSVGGISLVPPGVMLLVTLAGALFLARLAAGRRVYAVGGNELASRFSGLRVARVKLGVFLCSGLAAGLAALLSLGYYGAATSGDGQGYELNVIAAAVVGGASLTGGRGSALGALLGALVIQLISSGIVTVGIDQSYSQIIIGAVVILAVLLDQANGWLQKRQLTQARE